ncbi:MULTISPECIES: hypothetical protein [Micromonospora]|uniref:hypothetical protein n=1 Tax=Micromonospora TaxID=1873 RepID=UPI001CEC4A16|nr:MULTISPECIES: hypothetical protein [Micromonospora]MDX5460174.1 hypothetical protein [Micromonospora tulbaghiae]
MENLHVSAPLALHLYCRVDVLVTNAEALTDRAVAELRDADVDWSTEDDDLESAVGELRGSVADSLGAMVDISRLIEGVPGVEFRGGWCRAEPGPPREIPAPERRQ